MKDQEQEIIQAMDFETAFSALQENVSLLESEDLPLEKALEIYERGQSLARHCSELLETAELKIRQISMDTPQSNEEEA